MSLVLDGITKIYGAQHALDEISFCAKSGEIIGLLGPNGAGKTTTMKILTCFIPATKGNAEVCGFDVVKQPLDVRQHIGYLPEHNPLYLEMYVKEYLELIARIFKISKPQKRISELIEMTGLTREQSKKIQYLSKGYRQRVGIAQAMMHDPEVLILDEPTSGLDPNQLVDIRSLIHELGKEKLVVFSTHIMQEVQALCDRVIILDKGKLVADDPISALSQRVKGAMVLTVGFKDEIDLRKLENLEGLIEIKSIGQNEYKLTVDEQLDIREEIFDFAVANGNKILGMSQEKISVESVFQQITSNQKEP